MYTALKKISEDNGFNFFYGRRDFTNLFNEIEDKDKIYLFLDPVVIDSTHDEYGDLLNETHSGTFMLLKSSDLDEGYEERYQEDIKPLLDERLKIITTALSCTEFTINTWRTTEIINLFDYNMDGVIVNYSISI